MPIQSNSDPRHSKLRDHILTAYQNVNDGLQCPWNGRQGAMLKRFLQSCPWPIERLTEAVDNRFQSEDINTCQDPGEWIGKLTNYARGPLDRYNKPLYVPNTKAFDEWGERVQREAREALGRTQ